MKRQNDTQKKLPHRNGLIEEGARQNASMLLKALDNKRYGKTLEKGYFTSNQFKWLDEEAMRIKDSNNLKEYETRRVKDRQYKSRAKFTIIKSLITLVHASHVAPIFKDKEWQDIFDPTLIAQIAYISAYTGGMNAVTLIADGLNRGFDDHMIASSEGFWHGQVFISTSMDRARHEELSSDIEKRTSELVKERLIRKYRGNPARYMK